MKTAFSIVVAVDANFGIGRNNTLPWNLPGDMKHFKEVTLQKSGGQNVVIMGRKTWESIPEKFRPLPGRINCVLTRSAMKFPEGVLTAVDFEGALTAAQLAAQGGGIFVIGGGEIFNAAIHHPSCRTLYITHIQAAFACDRFFPPLLSGFKEAFRSQIFHDGPTSYFFSKYDRI